MYEKQVSGRTTQTAVIPQEKAMKITNAIASNDETSKNEEKIESIANTLKSKTKHKHHRHHHRHHCRKHRCRCRHRSHPISGTPLKVIIPNRPSSKTVETDDQQTPVQTNDSESKGNIPLQSVENKITSQRPTSTDETQVGSYATIIDPCCTPQVQQVQQICYEDSCCVPSTCATTCVVEQVQPLVCLAEQPQQQLYYCTDSSPTIVQRPQQYICVGNAPTAVQPNAYVSQTPNIIIQAQPQVQTLGGQYIEIASAGPQIIQAIPSIGGGQTIQVAPIGNTAASPQILYQRPYDPLVIPVQNQAINVAASPLVSLSRPSYAPSRVVVPAVPDRRAALGPNMFRHALVRTVANRVGLPVLSPTGAGGGLQIVQPPMTAPGRSPALLGSVGASTLSNLPVNPPRSASPPIIPLTPNGLLIPFQPSDARSNLSRKSHLRPFTGFSSNGRSYDLIQEQIRQRARLLDQLKQDNNVRAPSLPVMSPGTLARTSSTSTRSTTPIERSLPTQPPRIPPFRAPQPSTLSYPSSFPSSGINSQTPYAPKSDARSSSSSSSSSSSKSSASSANPRPSGQSAYVQQPFGDNRYGSLLSGPSAAYSSLQT